jgi:hypothetical protein
LAADKNSLTDQDLKFATDIAYLDLEVLKDNGRKQIPGSTGAGNQQGNTVGDLLKIQPEGREDAKSYDHLVAGKDTKGDQSISLSADKINNLPDHALDWKIAHTFDRNNPGQSGFYGVVIETDKGLIVSFRGSEAPNELQNIHQDWINADLALLEGRVTDQQQDANAFLRELKEMGYFEKYDNITFAGHSLGGNLAEHSTFYAAELGVIDRIDRTISYDGPGFTQEYLEKYKEYIEMATGTVDMDHVEQSLVGGLMQRVDGINYFFSELIGKGAVQHGTENVKFNPDGSIVTTDQPSALSTALSKYITSPFTQGMDRLVSPEAAALFTTALVAITGAGWALKDALFKDGKLTTAGKTVVATIAGGLAGIAIALGPVGTAVAAVAVTVALVKLVIGVVIVAAVFVAAVIAYDFIMDQIEAFVDYMINDFIPKALDFVTETVGKFVNWSKERLAEFGNMLKNGYKAFMDGLSHLFGAGPKVAATPHIRIDTYKLRQYAERLESLKARISSIDSDLNILYLTEGFLDIINLAIAENLPTKGQMNKVINYLQDTAAEFEAAEKRIMGI